MDPMTFLAIVVGMTIVYFLVWYAIERRLRVMTIRHAEKISPAALPWLSRVHRTQTYAIRVIFLLWIASSIGVVAIFF